MSPSGCPTCAPDVVAFNNALPAWAAGLTTTQSPIVLADVWTGFDLVVDTFDGVHPVTSGFIKMANSFFPVVAQVLGPTTTARPDRDEVGCRQRHRYLHTRRYQLRYDL